MDRKLSEIIFIALFFLSLSGCGKERPRMDDYLVNFATTLKEGNAYRFQLDDGKTLTPNEVKDYDGDNGQRVVLNYVPLEGNNIRIRGISKIFTNAIQTKGYPEKLAQDPVKIQSVWVGGNYLNMIVEVEYHSKAHTIALFQNTNSTDGIDLYFSHSRDDDPAGYPKKLYASFLLSGLRSSGGNAAAVPFCVFINTYDGVRQFDLELK